ncbi:MAG: amidohydrolase family protein [Bacillota bacterium]|nr:amidohydrolase family protein [Bacillota bacterium]
MEYDVIIRGGEVVDGRGTPRKKVDVAIEGDSIAAVGDLGDASAAKVVDATGLAVTPGFIDMHSHSDRTILHYPGGESSVGQGITTSVGGQCGSSMGPLGKYVGAGMLGANWRDKVAPAKYYAEGAVELDKVRKAAKEYEGFDLDWTTFGEWLDRVDAAKPGINLVPLVGHGAVRTAVMGKDTRRHATADEITAMKRLVAQAIGEGAPGISTGMDYPPGVFAAHEEFCEVVGEAARHGGFFSPHWRRTGLRQGFGNPGLINGLREALDVARRAGAKTQVAHLSSGYLINPMPTPKLAVAAAEETLVDIDATIRDGVDLAFDVIPNHLTGGTMHQKYVASTLAPWFKEAGSFERFADNLMAPDLRQEIRQFIMSGRWYALNPNLQPLWASGLMINKSAVSEFDGKTVAEIADARRKDPLDALMDVIAEDPRACGGPRRPYALDEALRVFYSHPMAMVGIDTMLVDETFEMTVPPYMYPNLNTFGGMARFVRMYAQGLLGLEEGVRRLTSLPAQRLGLVDRGVVAQGMKADLVVLKPEDVLECQDDVQPRQYPQGYHWVFVNGTAAMEDGKLTHSRSGKVLRKR